MKINTKGEGRHAVPGREQESDSTEKGPAGEPGRRVQEHRKNRDGTVKKGREGGVGSGDDRKKAWETEAAGKGKAAGKARRQGAATAGESGGKRKQGRQRKTEAAEENRGGRKKRRPPGKVRQSDRGSRTEMHEYTPLAKKRTRIGSAVGTNSKQNRNVESRRASACEHPEREIAPEGNKYQPPLTPPGRCRRLRSSPAARRTARPRPAKYSSSASGRSHS